MIIIEFTRKTQVKKLKNRERTIEGRSLFLLVLMVVSLIGNMLLRIQFSSEEIGRDRSE